MEYILSNVVPFIGRNTSLAGVSSDWRQSISKNNENLARSFMNRYPTAQTIGDALRLAFLADDHDHIYQFLNEYKGYLPVILSQFLTDHRNAQTLYPFLNTPDKKIAEEYLYSNNLSDRYVHDVVYILLEGKTPLPDSYTKLLLRGLEIGDIDLLEHIRPLIEKQGWVGILLRFHLQNRIKYHPYTLQWLLHNEFISLDIPPINERTNLRYNDIIYRILIRDDPSILDSLTTFQKVDLLREEFIYSLSPRIREILLNNQEVINDIANTHRIIPSDMISFLYIFDLIDQDGKDSIMEKSLKEGYVDILDKYLMHRNILRYMALMYPGDLSNIQTLMFLSHAGLYPEWFQMYLQGREGTAPISFWRPFLANAVALGNVALVKRILWKHKKNITSEMRERMIFFAENNPEMIKMINNLIPL